MILNLRKSINSSLTSIQKNLKPRIIRRFGSLHENLTSIREELRKLGHGSVTFDPKHSLGIGLLTLQNPKRHNALSGKMMAELSDIVDELENIVQTNTDANLNHENNECVLNKGDNLVGIIVTGSKNTFCSGLDLSVAKDHILTPENGKKMSLLMQDTLFRFGQLPLISVAAVEGHALGGGAELVTACDHRCISETSKIRFVQVKMCVIPGWGGGKRLIDIIGEINALKIMGTSEPITAKNGLELGFVDVIAPHGECVNRAREFLDRYVYFSERNEVGNRNGINEDRINSVKAVRGLKSLISRTKNNEEYKNFLRYEHELFCSLWGRQENVDAVLKPSKKDPMFIPDVIMFLSEEVEGYFTEEVLNEEEKFLCGESSKDDRHKLKIIIDGKEHTKKKVSDHSSDTLLNTQGRSFHHGQIT
ncbi:16779_t:CDS:2 [Cetraspora pellucida]|uniref:16779_t:CDS:1 n=1 Tax=Cetraspora pellucida TaxID=1433469 RepID=A0A9N9BFW9_9GLOM|nr:16779_t:CDS:2 [Cetraspora pellucida]